MSARAYLDHNATSPLRPEAREAMLRELELFGNPSSVHAEGRRARGVVETAREAVASALSAESAAVIFTSGGTEANNLAVLGTAADRLLVSAVEHSSVLEAARRSGKELAVLAVDSRGVIDVEALESSLRRGGGRALVSVMLANNETGALQPLRQVVDIARNYDAIVHTDAVQAVGKVEVSFEALGVDLMSVSAHKFGGPLGVGGLLVREGAGLTPLVSGGGQELRRRAGTENVAGIAGFGAAIVVAVREREPFAVRMTALRDRLERALDASGAGPHMFSLGASRLPNTTCFALEGLSAELMLMALDLEGVAVSSGSACSSGKVSPSHVLAAMGVGEETGRAALRVSFGWSSREEDVDAFAASLAKILARFSRRAAA